MFVMAGARKNLLKDERQRFIEKEWPKVAATIDRLGLDVETLLAGINKSAASGQGKEDD
jgi:GntR family transcriptional regulator